MGWNRWLDRYACTVPLISGVDQLVLPGDSDRSILSQRQANGIPIDTGNWSALSELTSALDVTMPNEMINQYD